MSRPKKTDNMITGKERIKKAFWELYMKKPIKDIGIKEVAALADCNRTTFYYHYDSLYNVLDEIESECVFSDAPQFFVRIMKNDGDLNELLTYVVNNQAKITRICHLLSSRGDPAFARKMKNALLEEWRKVLFPDNDQIPKKKRIILEYFMGGSLGLMASLSEDPEFTMEEVVTVLLQVFSKDMSQIIYKIIY